MTEEMAEKFLHQLKMTGEDLGEIETLDVIDSLAVAGLKLVDDPKMEASNLYFSLLK